MGHQFGGNHTFNGTTGNCGGGNRTASTAYEPGSGSTIMAYAGICGAEDLQPHSDDYFHSKSLDEIVAFSTGATGSSCAGQHRDRQHAAHGQRRRRLHHPAQTPFTLTGSATDPDGDPLTYMLGAVRPRRGRAAQHRHNAARPIFRSFIPITVADRTFPNLSDILNGNTADPRRVAAARAPAR